MKLLIATRNKHKWQEISALFAGSKVEIVSATSFPDVPDVVEDGATFAENAVLKAVSWAKQTGLWSLADDSGLEVDALDGQPGVYSARFAGEPVNNKANNDKLLGLLSGKSDRTARFHCVMALASPSGKAQTVDGACEGTIIHAPRGKEGFGYDPLFVPDGYKETFAELSMQEKNKISHRARALKKAYDTWHGILEKGQSDF